MEDYCKNKEIHCSVLWDHAHTLSVIFRERIFFARTIPVIPRAALNTLPQHIMWRGGEFGLGPDLGLASVHLHSCIQRGSTATVAALPEIQMGWIWGKDIKLETWNWALKSVPVP